MATNTPTPQHITVSGSSRFPWVGGVLCVDFANSLHSIDKNGDTIESWEDLVAFLEGARIVAASQASGLRDLEKTAPTETRAALRTALELRQAVRAAVESLTNQHEAPSEAVESINSILRLTMGHDELAPFGDGWVLRFVQREKRLEWLLAAIARSAADLIVQGVAAPIGKCANPRCNLYFYDTSRKGNRRWCSMQTCGNRSKVAAFAHRQKLVNKSRAATRRTKQRRPVR